MLHLYEKQRPHTSRQEVERMLKRWNLSQSAGAASAGVVATPTSGGSAGSTNREFAREVTRLIVESRWYSIAIILLTVLQEISALWPVALLGTFVDRLGTGNLGYTVWWLLGASLLYPAIVCANTILRHKMFYKTEFKKRVELTTRVRDSGAHTSMEDTGTANTRIVQAVSGVTNAAYHVLGSFTPVVVKIVVVAAALIAYNRTLGLIYVASLVLPAILTLVFNRMLGTLQRSGYEFFSRAEGTVIRALSEKEGSLPPLPDDVDKNEVAPAGGQCFVETLQTRSGLQFLLVAKSQWYLYIRQACLVGSQFLVVFVALAMREEIGLTPGDFTKILGYTAQVAAAFISAAGCLDAIVSYARAYRVYAENHGNC